MRCLCFVVNNLIRFFSKMYFDFLKNLKLNSTYFSGPKGSGRDRGQGAADPAQPPQVVRAGPAVQGQEVRSWRGERGCWR